MLPEVHRVGAHPTRSEPSHGDVLGSQQFASLWPRLCEGRVRIVRCWSSPEQYSIALVERDDGRALSDSDRFILEAIFMGSSQTAIASSINVAASTVAARAYSALRELGLTCRVSRSPLLLFVAVLCHLEQREVACDVRVDRFDAGGALTTISIPRNDKMLAERTTQAEYEVACLLIEGSRYDEIAVRLGVSSRTVANQVSTIFQKLGVATRSELLCSIARALAPRERRSPETPIEATWELLNAAIAADAASNAQVDPAEVWGDLMRGHARVVHDFFTEDRCYLVLSRCSRAPLEGRRLEILGATLSGLSQKSVAVDLNLAPSTVALNTRLALESIGVANKPSRVNPLLLLLARAGVLPSPSPLRTAVVRTARCANHRVLSVRRPDHVLTLIVPPAELAVVRSLVEGRTYGEIARQRGTSTRTIANQITAVFRRLRVSGRNELVHRLFIEGSGIARGSSSAGSLGPLQRAELQGRIAPQPRRAAATGGMRFDEDFIPDEGA